MNASAVQDTLMVTTTSHSVVSSTGCRHLSSPAALSGVRLWVYVGMEGGQGRKEGGSEEEKTV